MTDFLLLLGIILVLAYGVTICYVVVCEIIDHPHPTEDAVVWTFTKIGLIYALIVTVYIIGHFADFAGGAA